MKIDHLGKYKFFIWVTRPYSISREFTFLQQFNKEGLKCFLLVPESKYIGNYYLDEHSYNIVLKKVYKRILKSSDLHLNDYDKKVKDLLQKSMDLGSSAGVVADQQLLEKYYQYLVSTNNFFDYIFLPFALIQYTEPELKRKFANNFETIIAPEKATKYQLMEQMLLTESLEKVQKEWGWLNAYHVAEPSYSIAELEKIKTALDKNIVEKLFSSFSKNKVEFDKFIKQVKNSEDKVKCILFHQYAYLRNDRVDIWKRGLYLTRPFFKYLQSKFTNISLRAASNLTYEEIERILLNQKIPKESEIKKRDSAFIYYFTDSMHIVTDKQDIIDIQNMFKHNVSPVQEFTGTIANEGIAKGAVKIVNSYQELEKVNRGDILVAKVTDPRYTPYMRIASAIITDEGGVLSHASITSRELNLPCIVGTKIASKVLKDGDMVEVDANHGIVRKL